MYLDFHVLHCVKFWHLVLYHYVSYAHEVICVPERFLDTEHLFCLVINDRCLPPASRKECIVFIFHFVFSPQEQIYV